MYEIIAMIAFNVNSTHCVVYFNCITVKKKGYEVGCNCRAGRVKELKNMIAEMLTTISSQNGPHDSLLNLYSS